MAVRPDARLNMQKKGLEAAQKYEQEALERLRRINIISAGLEVVAPLISGHRDRDVDDGDETWYEDNAEGFSAAPLEVGS